MPLPAKSFTFTSAPSLMSSLMRRTSPRIAALCSRVSPLSFRLFTLSLVLDAEFGVPFWPILDCDWCFGVVSVGKTCIFHFSAATVSHTLLGEFTLIVFVLFTTSTMNNKVLKLLTARRGQSNSSNKQHNCRTYFTWAYFITFTRLNPILNHIYIIEFVQLLSQMIFETHSLNLRPCPQAGKEEINIQIKAVIR